MTRITMNYIALNLDTGSRAYGVAINVETHIATLVPLLMPQRDPMIDWYWADHHGEAFVFFRHETDAVMFAAMIG